MSDAEHEQIHRDLGVYVLGALEPAARDRVERHLSGCAGCRNELADLAVLPTLLSRLDETTAAATAAPSFEPVVERLARERRGARRRERVFAAVAAMVAVVAAVALLVGPPRADNFPQLAYASDDGLVTATVEDRPWGMAVHITAQGLPSRNGYVAQAVARDGHRAQIATWSDTGRPVTITGGCYLDAKDLTRLEIVDPDDDVLAVLTSH